MLLQALAEEYNASQSKYKVWLAEENAGKGQKQPDIYLLEFSKLVNLEQQNKLLKFEIPETAILPEAFKSSNGCWYGVFYDPAVLLVNQNFARRAGQENIRTWEDLLKIRGIRIALENLSDTESTRSFYMPLPAIGAKIMLWVICVSFIKIFPSMQNFRLPQ